MQSRLPQQQGRRCGGFSSQAPACVSRPSYGHFATNAHHFQKWPVMQQPSRPPPTIDYGQDARRCFSARRRSASTAGTETTYRPRTYGRRQDYFSDIYARHGTPASAAGRQTSQHVSGLFRPMSAAAEKCDERLGRAMHAAMPPQML